ncbi:MAG TPA: HIT family protein [Acidimicrobiia bacterium]|nr:HIT family protein [Acidimicrobiia bacterium]
MSAPGASDPTCLFCRIVAGTEPAHVVLDEPDVVAFLDVHPLFHGHTLVVPRRHVVTLPELPAELVAPVIGATQRVAAAVVNALDAQGSFVAMNNVVSQAVPHLHVHVVPRRRKDGLRGFFWPRTRYESDAEMAAVATRLRDALTS